MGRQSPYRRENPRKENGMELSAEAACRSRQSWEKVTGDVTRTEGINTRGSRRGERKTEKEEREGRETERGEGCRYREEKAEEEEKWVTRCKELIKSAVRYVRYRMVRYLRLQAASLLFLFLPVDKSPVDLPNACRTR